MKRFAVTEYPPREVACVEVDPHADMHTPGRPYRVTLWEPDTEVHESDVPHAVRNLSRSELAALARAIYDLLEAHQ